MRLPSGEMEICVELRMAGVGIWKINSCGCASGVYRRLSVGINARKNATLITSANDHARRSCSFRLLAKGAGVPTCELPSATHLSCSIRSCAVCHRSAGSFARHIRTTWSSAGGDIGWMLDIDGGTDDMMEEIRLAWLRP